jgi:hypothetical protein
MIKYEKDKDKRITISILSGNKFKMRKTNLDIIEVIELLTVNLAAVVADNLTTKETDSIIEELKHNIEWYIIKKTATGNCSIN